MTGGRRRRQRRRRRPAHRRRSRRPSKDVIGALRKSATAPRNWRPSCPATAPGCSARSPPCTAAYTVALASPGRRRDLGRTDADDDLVARGRADQPVAAPGRRRRRAVRRGRPPSTRSSTATGWCRRMRRPTSTPWSRRDGRAPERREAHRDARRPIGGPAAARRRLSAADEVDNPTDAANLAVRMEEDAAVAWRAVLEQATTNEDRAFAVTALTQCAAAAALEPGARGLADHRGLPRRQRVGPFGTR